MKRKILIVLLTFIGVVCLSLFAVACGNKDGNGRNGSDKEAHTHSYSEYISPTHATCSEAGLKGHYRCTVCGEYFDIYKRPVSVDELATEIDPDAHNFEGGSNCTICNVASNYTRGLTYFETSYGYGVRAGTGIESETEIVIPCAYKGKPVTSIRESAFWNCTNLTSITIPDSVTSIGEYSFSSCTSLESITIPDSVTTIGGRAFNGCTSLKSITIPDSVTSIGEYAFSGCTSLETVYWNATNCETAGQYNYPIFKGCTALKTINIGESVERIPSYAFYDCSGLTSITIPDSVTSIGEYAFYHCTSLESVNLGNNSKLTSIVELAFYYCTSLTSITIPNSVTSIGRGAFYECNKLIQKDGGVQYVDKWVLDCNDSVSSVILRKDTKGIANYAFNGCTSLTSITIPDSVTSIGEYSFSSCTNLTSITIPDSVTSIGEYSFSSCTSLESITIPDSVTTIGGRAFNGCTSLESITIPDGVTFIGGGAFGSCARLEKVYYAGTPEKWNELHISNSGGNDKLLNAKRYYYSAEMPNDENWQNDYWWHYDSATGQPVVWTKEN